MISKRKIINGIFVVSILFFGLGQYVSGNINTPAGHIISILPHILLILFYAIDSLYRKRFTVKINSKYFVFLLFILSAMVARFAAMSGGVPGFDLLKTITGGLLFLIPIHGYLIWNIYNVEHDDFDPVRLFIIAMSIFLVVNLLAVGVGIESKSHSFEGRIALPFAGGIYDGGNMLAVFSIMIFPYLVQLRGSALKKMQYLVFMVVILGLLMSINARLTTVILLFMVGLFITRLAYLHRITFLASWFMIPFLLSFSLLVYQILSLPIFASILKRVDMEDVMTYNSRSYLWENGLDWITKEQTGILLGNGTNGHATLKLYEKTDLFRNIEIMGGSIYDLHSHSSMLDIFTAQGIIGMILLATVFYLMMVHYKRARKWVSEEFRFYPVVIYLLYLMQVDGFLVPTSLGFLLVGFLASRFMLKKQFLPELKEQAIRSQEEILGLEKEEEKKKKDRIKQKSKQKAEPVHSEE